LVRGGKELLHYDRLVLSPEWRALIPLVEGLGRDPSIDLPRLALYARLVLAWNGAVSNLVSRNDEDRIISRHIRESIEPAPLLAETGVADWIDFGSGAGFPAIPLALVGIGREWNLVESRRPKTLFMRMAVQELELLGVRVTHARLEDVIVEGTGPSSISGILDRSDSEAGDPESHVAAEMSRPPITKADGCGGLTSRATVGLAETLELAARIVRPGGFVFLWKGSRRSDELAERLRWEDKWELEAESPLSSGEVAICKFKLMK
jgi:16S rRNA G527 N7-methylase RsmG